MALFSAVSSLDLSALVHQMECSQARNAEAKQRLEVGSTRLSRHQQGPLLTLYWRLHFWIFRFALLDL